MSLPLKSLRVLVWRIETVQGMRFDKGYVSHYMATNNDRMEAEYMDPYILITDKKYFYPRCFAAVRKKLLKAVKRFGNYRRRRGR